MREVKYSSDYITRPLTEQGITRRMYAAIREDDAQKPYMKDWIGLATEVAERLRGE